MGILIIPTMNGLEEKFLKYEESLIDYIMSSVEERLNNNDYGTYRERKTLEAAREKLLRELSGQEKADVHDKSIKQADDDFDSDRTQ